MRKGNVVKLNPDVCFTAESGGALRFPLTNWANDRNRVAYAGRPTTLDEQEAWRNSDASRGPDGYGLRDGDGEPMMAPRWVAIYISADDLLVVERARCQVVMEWHRVGGMAKVFHPATGESVYIKRDLLDIHDGERGEK
jgi:hypothetical protein